MYAVIKTGGKQYKVASNDVIKIEKIAGDAGSEVIFNEVLAIDDAIGTPFVAGASVKGTIVKQAKDAKVIVFKKKRRHLSRFQSLRIMTPYTSKRTTLQENCNSDSRAVINSITLNIKNVTHYI